MRIEIVKLESGAAEVRRHEADGSVTSWACESDEAAIFLAASLLYKKTPDAKRSILLGTFVKKDDPRVKLQEVAEELGKKLLDEGLVPLPSQEAPAKPTPIPNYPTFVPASPGWATNSYVTYGTSTSSGAVDYTITTTNGVPFTNTYITASDSSYVTTSSASYGDLHGKISAWYGTLGGNTK